MQSPDDKPSSQATPLTLTAEQQSILQSTGNIKINAVAGSGKTTTIIQYAASRPKGSRMLYLAFNKSVRMEAKKRFGELGLHKVQVETAHSLAFKHVVFRRGYSVAQKSYTSYDIAGKLGLQGNGEMHGEFILANHILKFIAYFCNSNAQKVQDLNYLELVSDPKAKTFVRTFYSTIEQGTRLLLAKMHKGEMEVTHDFYLKMFQLSNPVLDYDYILFDEGQDASPAMLDIFLKQKAVKVIVGDAHQQIYGWRHAVNSLAQVDFHNFHLSTSFRFNQSIANLAKEILSWKKHFTDFQPVTITGKGSSSQIKTSAILARTNLGLLLKAITYIREHKHVKHIYFEGNLNSYTYADDGASLYDVLSLYGNNRDRIKDKLIASMNSLADLEDYIEKTEDMQLSMMVEIVQEYGFEIPSLINSLKTKHVGDDERDKAEIIFSTVHRAKGMEYDSVHLAEDFVTEAKLEKLKTDKKDNEPINVAKWNEEVNLLYVAVTRAKGLLRIPQTLVPKDFKIGSGIQVMFVKKEEVYHHLSASKIPLIEPFPVKKKNQKYTYADKRLQHKNSYERWTPELDAQLKKMFNEGIDTTALAAHFGRKEQAILSRLKKIGCDPGE